MRRPPAILRHVGELFARRDRRLVGIGGDGDVAVHPIGIADIVARLRGGVFELGHAQLGGQALLAALGAILEQPGPVHAEQRRELAIVEEGAVGDHPRIVALRAQALLPALALERQCGGGAGR